MPDPWSTDGESIEHEAPVRVFLVDDHEVVRRSVRGLLELSGGIVVVGEDGSAETAGEQILASRPDVAIVDLRLGDGSGIDVCRQVHAETGDVATLILTADDEQEALLATTLAGATGYVLKLVRSPGLVASVRRAAAGDTMVDDRQRSEVVARLCRRNDSAPGWLSEQDCRLLDLIAEGRTDAEIAARMQPSTVAVSTQVSSLLVKLGFQRWVRPAVGVPPVSSPYGA